VPSEDELVQTLLERRGISDRFAVVALSTGTKQTCSRWMFLHCISKNNTLDFWS